MTAVWLAPKLNERISMASCLAGARPGAAIDDQVRIDCHFFLLERSVQNCVHVMSGSSSAARSSAEGADPPAYQGFSLSTSKPLSMNPCRAPSFSGL